MGEAGKAAAKGSGEMDDTGIPRHAVCYGIDAYSLAVASRLQTEHWQVKRSADDTSSPCASPCCGLVTVVTMNEIVFITKSQC